MGTISHLALLQARHGVVVTITRGMQTCELTAVPAKSDATLVGADGSFTKVVIADWLIVVADWTLTGPATPAKGDQIAIGEDKWLVGHPDTKQPTFRSFNQLDRPALAWRVHSVPR